MDMTAPHYGSHTRTDDYRNQMLANASEVGRLSGRVAILESDAARMSQLISDLKSVVADLSEVAAVLRARHD